MDARTSSRGRREDFRLLTGSGRYTADWNLDGQAYACFLRSDRAHAEIARQTRRLGQLIDEIGPGQPDDADVADLRALLYGLHAILRLHTAQEDESFLSLASDAADHQPAG